MDVRESIKMSSGSTKNLATFCVSLSLLILINNAQLTSAKFKMPPVTLGAVKPSGLLVSIPDVPGMQRFSLHGKKNKKINILDQGEFEVEILHNDDRKWSAVISDVDLDVGDVVHYWVSAQVDRLEYRKDQQSWQVTEFTTLNEIQPTIENAAVGGNACKQSASKLSSSSSKTFCSGEVMFQSDFGSSTWSNQWIKQHRIPDPINGPDFEFNYYKNQGDSVFVRDRILYLKPVTIANLDNLHGSFDIEDRCTSKNPNECVQNPGEPVPPVVTGRVNTKEAFRYGAIEIVAKLPKGDWIYPQLYLEPKNYHYGDGFASGRLMVAFSRGNQQLRDGSANEYGSTVLYGGAVLGSQNERNCALKETKMNTDTWNSDYRNYTLVWKPNEISTYVDGSKYGSIKPPPGGFAKCAQKTSGQTTKSWSTAFAPFDQEFVITLGVGIGGRNDFPDNVKSDQTPKPWKNLEVRALLKFFSDHGNWFKTWKDDDTALKVKSVRVYAV